MKGSRGKKRVFTNRMKTTLLCENKWMAREELINTNLQIMKWMFDYEIWCTCLNNTVIRNLHTTLVVDHNLFFSIYLCVCVSVLSTLKNCPSKQFSSWGKTFFHISVLFCALKTIDVIWHVKIKRFQINI